MLSVSCEMRGSASVAWVKGSRHKFYEDRYRLLPMAVPLVKRLDRGELFAVFDGIGSAPKGREAAQEMADRLLKFYQEPDHYPGEASALNSLLLEGNDAIYRWGFMERGDVPLGGCAGTIAWVFDDNLYIFHAGDTAAVLIREGESPLTMTRNHQLESGAISRYFGLGPQLEIETSQSGVKEADRILLLTDGVTKVMSLVRVCELINDWQESLHAVKAVAQRALALGSTDDITVLLVEIE